MKKKDILKGVCLKIKKKEGKVTPKALVDYARAKDSPIHYLFEWDDEKAAEEYRLWQARELIVTVKIEDRGQEMQVYHNIKVADDQGYYHLEDIKKDKSLLSEVIKNAIKQLEYWQAKYETYSSLMAVINQKRLNSIKESVGYISA